MNMFPLILHIVQLERGLEDQQREYRSQFDSINTFAMVRTPRKKHFNWLFDRLPGIKLVITPSKKASLAQKCCRSEKRPLDPVVSQCPPL
jgi:hypothetical protein